jgi:transposase
MLNMTARSRIFLATASVDFRNGLDGLIGLCRNKLARDPNDGAIFAFINRDRTRVRLLVYDGTGYWLCMKRLSEGRFTGWPRSEDALASIDAKKLLLILIGPKGLPDGASGAWKKVI